MKILVQCKVYELLMDFWKYLLNSAKLTKRCTWFLKIFYLHDFCTQKNTRIQNFLRLLKQIYPFVLTDPAIVLFMIMIIFVIVRGQYVEFFLFVCLYLYFRWRSNYQEWVGNDPINSFNHTTFVCLSQVRISTFKCHGLLCFQWYKGKRWLLVLLILMELLTITV